jgi:mRNA interferase RelE/StbE
MNYDVRFSEKALKSLKKTDKYQARLILSWISKNLAGCTDPRLLGKPLVGDKKDYWRYRVGSYRIIAEIEDKRLLIIIINVADRRAIYD